MEEMKRQVAGMSPDAINSAMNMMKNANPEDIKRQMKNQPMPSNTDEMKRHMNAFEQHTTSQNQYKYNASLKLKTEGNAFFSAGKHAEAREKYTLAKKNLSGVSSLEARKLHRTCMLNEAACCLGLEQWEEAARLCNHIIKNAAADKENPLTPAHALKTHYRKGQALLRLERYEEAHQDLLAAHNLSPQDEGVASALEKAKAGLGEPRVEEVVEPKVEEVGVVEVAEEEAAAGKVEEVTVEDVTAEEVKAPAAGSQVRGTAPLVEEIPEAAAAPTPPEAEMVKKMASMSDEDLVKMAKLSGMPENAVNPDMMRMATEAMSNMSAEEIKQMSKISQQMRDSGFGPGAAAAAAGAGTSAAAGMEQQVQKMMTENPDMMKQAAEMMGNMNEEDLKAMAKMSGMPEDSMNPGMMKAATEAMSKMSADDLAKMAKLAGQPGASGMAGGDGSKLEKMAAATEVFGGMTAESIQAVSKEMGHELSDSQAQLMRRFVAFVAFVLKSLVALQKRKYLVLAFLVVLLGIWLRRRMGGTGGGTVEEEVVGEGLGGLDGEGF